MTIEIISAPIEATVTITPPIAPVGSVTLTDPSAPAELITVTNPSNSADIAIEQTARAAELIAVTAPPVASINVEDRRVQAQITVQKGEGGPGVDLDRMINPAYPDTVREIGAGVITVLSGASPIFERTFTYDSEDRITAVQTDDLTGTARLIRTITYDGDYVSEVRREVTTQ